MVFFKYLANILQSSLNNFPLENSGNETANAFSLIFVVFTVVMVKSACRTIIMTITWKKYAHY